MDILIHFVEDKTISEAQLLALSAEIVFLATTNDSSSVSLATDHTHHRSIGNAKLRCQTALNDPRSQTLSLPCSSPKNRFPLFSYTPISCVAFYWWIQDHVTMLQLQRNLGKQDRSHNIVCFLQWEGRVFTWCKLARKRTNFH